MAKKRKPLRSVSLKQELRSIRSKKGLPFLVDRKTQAAQLGFDERTIDSAIAGLEAAGYIKRGPDTEGMMTIFPEPKIQPLVDARVRELAEAEEKNPSVVSRAGFISVTGAL